MPKPGASAVDGRGRIWSLRREWSRAFAIILLLLAAAGLGTFAVVKHLVDSFSGTAQRYDRQTTAVALLKLDLAQHELAANQLLAGMPVDRSAYLRQAESISIAFDEARLAMPGGNATVAALVTEADQRWQVALTTAGLWGGEVQTFVAPAEAAKNEATRVALARSTDQAGAVLDGLAKPSLDAMHAGLAADARLERLVTAGLAGIFGLLLLCTLYFFRRMAKDLLRPVASMHRGASRLQAGDYQHRIEVVRHDELGEVAQAFNCMAGALRDSRRALTLGATHDSLTGLANRATLTERLSGSFRPDSTRRARYESVLFIDVDDFKVVNELLGHEGGDALLVQLATRLSGCVRPLDLVARIGGDEFAIVVAECDSDSAAIAIADRVLAMLRTPFLLDGARLAVSASIGVAYRRPETADVGELLSQADFAMNTAKESGKGRCQVFDSKTRDDMAGRATSRPLSPSRRP